MNREIKFRVWDADDKKMLYPGLYWFEEQHIDKWPEDKEYTHGHYEVMQFIGLKDKNSQEIYEGDILKATPYYRNRPVLWEDVVQGLASSNDEVIGNIYETPELLDVT